MMKLLRALSATLFLLLLLSTIPALGADLSMLRPPAGAKVAIIVFEDMECPTCAITSPLLHQAATTYKIPLVQYDYPLPMHPWSFQAAVNAQWFETKSKKLGDEYRSYIFEHQSEVNKDNLRSFSDRFAAQHKVTLPLFVDPKGELAAKVRAEADIGHRVGIEHTPTVYLVSNTPSGPSVLEFRDYNDLSTNLYSQIDAALKQARATAAPARSRTRAPQGKAEAANQ